MPLQDSLYQNKPLFNKLQLYENTVSYKRKSTCRFFLLMRLRTPLISSEFRGGGFEPPKPPPRYATASDNVRHPVAKPFTTLHYTSMQIVHQLSSSNLKLKKIAIFNMLIVFITKFVNVAYSLQIHYSLHHSTELTGL